ncbi:12105_t:CDS:2, partial [Gigaspora rosea]
LVDRLASRIVDKAREKDRGKKNNRSKNRQEGRVDTDLGFAIREENFDRRSETTDGDAGVQGFSVPDLQYIAIEKSLEKMVQATMEKVVNDFRKIWKFGYELDSTIASTSIANTKTVSASTIWFSTELDTVLTSSSNLWFKYDPELQKLDSLSSVVCFICEEQGHIAWDCPQKKSGQPFHRAIENDGMARERDIAFFKRHEIVSTNEGAETDRVYGNKLEWVERELERLMKMHGKVNI